jgi:hypothetical protein
VTRIFVPVKVIRDEAGESNLQASLNRSLGRASPDGIEGTASLHEGELVSAGFAKARMELAPRVGFEPTASRLTAECSTLLEIETSAIENVTMNNSRFVSDLLRCDTARFAWSNIQAMLPDPCHSTSAACWQSPFLGPFMVR